VWVQYGLVASSIEEQIRRVVLAGYDKSQPPEDLLLTYQIIYTHCPIPDSATGTLISEVHEIQVRLTSLSVQCYAWTEYNFTCVCDSVCVCPSHFLSTRLQVRPLNGFFTVDSLKDADLRKDVPFGGFDDE